MKLHLPLTAVLLGLAAGPALADETCAWAGGAYAFKDHGIYGDFTVNGDCTELVWSRLSDDPETAAMERTKDGWKGDLKNAKFELLENGSSLRVSGYGGVTRPSTATRKN